MHDDEWLFSDHKGREPLQYDLGFIRRTSGDYLSLLELRSNKDLKVAETCYEHGDPFGEICEGLGIRLGRELNMTDDAWRFTPSVDVLPLGEDPRDPEIAARLIEMGYLTLHEGKTFRQYDDHWAEPPRYLVAIKSLLDKPNILWRTQYFRMGYRDIAGPGDQNISIFNFHTPGITTGHTAPLEHEPHSRPNSKALAILATTNSFTFDWILQLRVRSHINQFMLLASSFPTQASESHLLSHSALRLTCNHRGYAVLWNEQLAGVWREASHRPLSWPVLSGNDQRWVVRAAIDAVVARFYGLSRDQYAHLLSTFNHKGYPRTPVLCLDRFDELKSIGLEVFTRKYDPYWDIPLNEKLPQPVIDLPVAGSGQSSGGDPVEEPRFQLSDKPARQRARTQAMKPESREVESRCASFLAVEPPFHSGGGRIQPSAATIRARRSSVRLRCATRAGLCGDFLMTVNPRPPTGCGKRPFLDAA